jgi:hypothetical protein
MNRWIAVVAAVSLAAACSKEAPPPAAVAPAGHASPNKPMVMNAPRAPYSLDADKLTRYLQYKKAVIGASSQALQHLAKVGPDAGALSVMMTTGGSLQDMADADTAALKASGLTKQDINAIEPMVSDVTGAIWGAEQMGQTNMIPMLEAQLKNATPENRPQMEKTVAEMKAQQEARTKLTKEREKWGDANVDVMVAQKDALLENFKSALGILAGGAKPPK